jgi:hypothetical protein
MNKTVLLVLVAVAIVWYMNKGNVVDFSGRDPG